MSLEFYNLIKHHAKNSPDHPAIIDDETITYGQLLEQVERFAGGLTGLELNPQSKIGIFYLMIKFGASFGFAVMGRISLLIGRINQLKDYSTAEYNYATPTILVVIIISLAIWSFMDGDKKKESAA